MTSEVPPAAQRHHSTRANQRRVYPTPPLWRALLVGPRLAAVVSCPRPGSVATAPLPQYPTRRCTYLPGARVALRESALERLRRVSASRCALLEVTAALGGEDPSRAATRGRVFGSLRREKASARALMLRVTAPRLPRLARNSFPRLGGGVVCTVTLWRRKARHAACVFLGFGRGATAARQWRAGVRVGRPARRRSSSGLGYRPAGP